MPICLQMPVFAYMTPCGYLNHNKMTIPEHNFEFEFYRTATTTAWYNNRNFILGCSHIRFKNRSCQQ